MIKMCDILVNCLRWIPRSFSRDRDQKGFIPFNRSASCNRIRKHDQNLDSIRFSSGRHTKRDEFPRPMGFILCSEYQVNTKLLNREQVPRWTSASEWSSLNKQSKAHPNMETSMQISFLGCRYEFPRPMGFIFARLQHSIAGMNSRLKWGSLPCAQSNSSTELGLRKSTSPVQEEMNFRVQWGSFSFNNSCDDEIQKFSTRLQVTWKVVHTWTPVSNGIHSGAPV